MTSHLFDTQEWVSDFEIGLEEAWKRHSLNADRSQNLIVKDVKLALETAGSPNSDAVMVELGVKGGDGEDADSRSEGQPSLSNGMGSGGASVQAAQDVNLALRPSGWPEHSTAMDHGNNCEKPPMLPSSGSPQHGRDHCGSDLKNVPESIFLSGIVPLSSSDDTAPTRKDNPAHERDCDSIGSQHEEVEVAPGLCPLEYMCMSPASSSHQGKSPAQRAMNYPATIKVPRADAAPKSPQEVEVAPGLCPLEPEKLERPTKKLFACQTKNSLGRFVPVPNQANKTPANSGARPAETFAGHPERHSRNQSALGKTMPGSHASTSGTLDKKGTGKEPALAKTKGSQGQNKKRSACAGKQSDRGIAKAPKAVEKGRSQSRSSRKHSRPFLSIWDKKQQEGKTVLSDGMGSGDARTHAASPGN
jgi:hypothetical protein